MTKTTCLVLDKSDFTKDLNIRSEVFEAIIAADVVVHNDRVVKNNLRSAEPTAQEFLPLDTRPTTATPPPVQPTSTTEPSGI